jgi:hypothetical protein
MQLSTLMTVEGASFLAASLLHRGLPFPAAAHAKAATAETVIGAVLLAGAALAVARPARRRAIALAAQGFAAAGTCVGIGMVAIGVGPRTAPDAAYHAGILALLVAGLVAAARRRAPAAG